MLKRLELTLDQHYEPCITAVIKISNFYQLHLIYLHQPSFEYASMENSFGEITNLPYLRAVGVLAQPVIATGMSDLGEIEDAINILEQSGTPRK